MMRVLLFPNEQELRVPCTYDNFDIICCKILGNIIQFAVHINKCPLFGYHGYGILEVREDTLIVWSQGESEEVVRWKLGHLRSFKAKTGVLEIIAGRYRKMILFFNSHSRETSLLIYAIVSILLLICCFQFTLTNTTVHEIL